MFQNIWLVYISLVCVNDVASIHFISKQQNNMK